VTEAASDFQDSAAGDLDEPAARDTDEPAASEPEVVWLLEPAGGLPPVVVDEAGLARLAARLAAGHGPVAVDAERASGYRYSARAYLVQLRRAGAGSSLIDPAAVADLRVIDGALADAEWVLHAANQDLACLAEVGMRPRALFDTELASRLLGYPRVALGTMVEQLLGIRLEKGHSAADWSTRPLPESWLTYAALDVELLVPLRDVLERQLADAGKLDWAHQEFAAVMVSALIAPVPRVEPWRRLSGIHKLRSPRQLAAARALWRSWRPRLAGGSSPRCGCSPDPGSAGSPESGTRRYMRPVHLPTANCPVWRPARATGRRRSAGGPNVIQSRPPG